MKKLPKWVELPQLDLYLDQVLLYVNEQTISAISKNEKPLTPSMINNYVKHGHLEKPIKKKYNQHHVARLIVISLAKAVFAIADICAMIDLLSKERSADLLYDDFMTCLQEGQSEVHPVIAHACATIRSYQKTLQTMQKLEEVQDESNL
ncbi:DUF1836 domain-containing protein [Streptococcus sp. X16XC17]|uniref:DUF1836 domain-containing protein n=1 Tax=unclassified Streptococcus TaxID=2608887 RepID=UPI00066FD6D6|nr:MULTISPECIES: DUF1836 domain-containing protein [unclassified Streptococcus]TCD46188.1 DUF1836 domain-containing protein [Streptococcus sp. X16XC17]